MISNQEDDEFVAVRVQDPRIQNEGSWNSYVDYKIFLHTNSKAFTAKTSCVRRRYSEFAWLRKKLQKNAGLVPVPDLPGKSFFSFSNEDFLEGRRKGLQVFLDKVVHMTVCLSDSQLHLFLQTQLPVGHIQDCVQGHTPYSVTDAILTYASSNRGLAQAQEDDSIKEPSLTVSYESMESPAPHQPCLQTKDIFSPELFSCSDPDPVDVLLETCDKDTAELQHKEKSSISVLQKSDHLEAVIEDCGPTEASFFLGETPEEPGSLSLAEQTQQRSCQIQTPVEVHSPMGTGFEEKCGMDSTLEEEESIVILDTEEMTVPHPDTEEKADQKESSWEDNVEKCVTAVESSDFKDSDIGPEKQVLENLVTSELNGLELVCGTEGHVADVDSDGQKKPDSDELGINEETPLHSEIREEAHNVHNVPEVESDSGEDTAQQKEVDLDGTKDESDDDSHSLPSSNESIVKVSEEESVSDETEDLIQAANGYMKTEELTHWSDVEASSRSILDLHMNGKEDISTLEDDELQYMTDIGDLSKSLDVNSTVTGGDLTENSDFSILETSCTSGLADSKCTEQENLSSLSLDASEETREVEVH